MLAWLLSLGALLLRLSSGQEPRLVEAFPGVRVDMSGRVVEFDATISPMLVKDDRAPHFYLEVVCCSPNTREHETFVISKVKPSHVHAALLSAGFTPGKPGAISFTGKSPTVTQPTGDRVSVRFVHADRDGKVVEADPLTWIVSARDGAGFVETLGEPRVGWVFSGSRLVERQGGGMYDADGAGTIIGLATFGSEVVALSRVISPDASVEAPQWIADFSKTPPAGTPVKVRLRGVKAP